MTTQDVLIRDEKKSDFTTISDVTVAAFETMEISNHTEQFIIEALRAAKALTISFGFNNVDGLVHEGVPQEVFFVLSFDGNIPKGHVLFHEGFKANGQQGASADG